MKTKIKTKNKNKTKIKLAVFLFFALAQIGRADVSSGAFITAQDMVELTNGSRMEAGLAPLAINGKLAEAAREKANDMFKLQYFDHNSPNGTTPWDFIKSAGYEYRYAGENLAIDFISASGAHSALMESSPHRDNILNMNYTEIGIAVKEDIFEGNKSIIIVEEFAAPLYIEKIYIEKTSYNLNENVELIPEEKAIEINNLPEKEEEIIVENVEVKTNIPIIENKDETDLSAAQNKPILSVKNSDSERIMGLANEALFKEEYLNKFRYQANSSLNGYFQDELAARVLTLNLFLAILLIIDFWFIARINPRHLMPEIN